MFVSFLSNVVSRGDSDGGVVSVEVIIIVVIVYFSIVLLNLELLVVVSWVLTSVWSVVSVMHF